MQWLAIHMFQNTRRKRICNGYRYTCFRIPVENEYAVVSDTHVSEYP